MSLKLLLILSAIAILATVSTAQNNSSQSPSGPNETRRLVSLEEGLARALESDDDDVAVPDMTGRPRIVDPRSSEVKSSVIVNIARVERIVFDLVNKQRAENGQLPLAWSDQLEMIARRHSQNMAEFNFFSHRGLDNKLVSDRADDTGLKKWRAIGENIAYNRGYQDPLTRAVELWLNSPAHRHNMMNQDWKESAIGVAIAADGSYYFTQVFLKK